MKISSAPLASDVQIRLRRAGDAETWRFVSWSHQMLGELAPPADMHLEAEFETFDEAVSFFRTLYSRDSPLPR